MMQRKKFIILLFLTACLILSACGSSKSQRTSDLADENLSHPLILKYAAEFSADIYDNGYRHIHISDGTDYVIVPEGKEPSDLGYKDAVIICQPLDSVYVAASSVMDLMLQLDAVNNVSAVSTKASDFSMPEITSLMDNGSISYVGKYSAPDYELLLGKKCSMAIESTMITHSPKIKDQLISLGIPVLTEKSSYEAEPLGRLEWIKLYGILFSKETEAEKYFDTQCAKLEDICSVQDNTKTVAFFYLSSNGYVNIRKPGDYITRMIEMAGGSYAFEKLNLDEDNALSTININWEDFYTQAVNADILIYNSTVDGGISSISDLIDKNALFADFKAVKEGNVWCTGLNMYQKTGAIADVVHDLSVAIGSSENNELVYLTKADS